MKNNNSKRFTTSTLSTIIGGLMIFCGVLIALIAHEFGFLILGIVFTVAPRFKIGSVIMTAICAVALIGSIIKSGFGASAIVMIVLTLSSAINMIGKVKGGTEEA